MNADTAGYNEGRAIEQAMLNSLEHVFFERSVETAKLESLRDFEKMNQDFRNSGLCDRGGVTGDAYDRGTANHRAYNPAEAAALRARGNDLKLHSSNPLRRAAERDVKKETMNRSSHKPLPIPRPVSSPRPPLPAPRHHIHPSPLHQSPAKSGRNASSLKEAVSSAAHARAQCGVYQRPCFLDPNDMDYNEQFMCYMLESAFNQSVDLCAIERDGHCLYGSFCRFLYPGITKDSEVDNCIKHLRELVALYQEKHTVSNVNTTYEDTRLEKISNIRCLDSCDSLRIIAPKKSWGDDVSVETLASIIGINAIMVYIDEDKQMRFRIYANKVVNNELRSRVVISADVAMVKKYMKSNISIVIGLNGDHFSLYQFEEFEPCEYERLQDLVSKCKI